MKSALVCLALICLVSAAPKWHQLDGYTFEQYVSDFSKNYEQGSAEYKQRQLNFESKLAHILSHNADESKTYKMGVNAFTDLSRDEFKAKHTGYNKALRSGYPKQEQYKLFLANEFELSPEQLAALPASVDWRQKNVVTPVKNQGGCGSCWAFATTEVAESHAAINSGKLLVLSPEQLVQCMPNPNQCGGTGGCSGAIAELGFDYIKDNGLTLDSLYPYSSAGGQTGSCSYNKTSQPPQIAADGHVKLPVNNYAALLQAVATVGPIAISVDASNWSAYEQGVYSDCDYSQNIDIDHAVVLVGYGTDAQLGDYWIVRNSWGESYGESGYIRVKRDAANTQCGTDSTPQDGTACKGETQPQQVCGQCGILSDSSYPLNARVVAH